MTSGWPITTHDGPRVVTLTQDAVETIVARCYGDPFLFQLAGQCAWDYSDGPIIAHGDVEQGWIRDDSRPSAG